MPDDLTSAWPNRDYCCSPAPNSCALNCRAVGERFYATLEPAVMDGTPCDAPNLRGRSGGGISTERNGERWLCVAGQCKVWIARALGERTMPEINDRYRADAIRYDRWDRYWVVLLGPSRATTFSLFLFSCPHRGSSHARCNSVKCIYQSTTLGTGSLRFHRDCSGVEWWTCVLPVPLSQNESAIFF